MRDPGMVINSKVYYPFQKKKLWKGFNGERCTFLSWLTLPSNAEATVSGREWVHALHVWRKLQRIFRSVLSTISIYFRPDIPTQLSITIEKIEHRGSWSVRMFFIAFVPCFRWLHEWRLMQSAIAGSYFQWSVSHIKWESCNCMVINVLCTRYDCIR